MLLGCSYGRCQWTGVETSEQTPWCSTLLHPYAAQLCVHPRSKIPQRGPGFLCWRQTTYCAGMHLSHNYKQSKSVYNKIASTDFLNSGVLCCIPHWPSSIAVIDAVFQVQNCCKAYDNTYTVLHWVIIVYTVTESIFWNTFHVVVIHHVDLTESCAFW